MRGKEEGFLPIYRKCSLLKTESINEQACAQIFLTQLPDNKPHPKAACLVKKGRTQFSKNISGPFFHFLIIHATFRYLRRNDADVR